MRFWKTVVHDFGEPTDKTTWWFTNKAEAEREQRQHHSATVQPVDVPTDRKRLCDFLNTHIWRG